MVFDTKTQTHAVILSVCSPISDLQSIKSLIYLKTIAIYSIKQRTIKS